VAANSKFAVATHVMAVLGYFYENPMPIYTRHDGLVSSDTVARSVNTNPVVVRRILSQLAKARLVSSHLGKQGGVKLARPVNTISLLDIYLAVGESPFFSHNPNEPNPVCPVSCKIKALIQPVFDQLTDSVKAQLSTTTLASLLAQL